MITPSPHAILAASTLVSVARKKGRAAPDDGRLPRRESPNREARARPLQNSSVGGSLLLLLEMPVLQESTRRATRPVPRQGVGALEIISPLLALGGCPLDWKGGKSLGSLDQTRPDHLGREHGRKTRAERPRLRGRPGSRPAGLVQHRSGRALTRRRVGLSSSSVREVGWWDSRSCLQGCAGCRP